VSTTLSSVTELSNFTSHSVPFPIITALGAKAWERERSLGLNATTYEFTPFEFGSWDSDVSAFTPTHYLGTSMKAGVPTGSCTTNYDNLGYILGTSSNRFNEVCSKSPALGNSFGNLVDRLATVIQKVTTSALYAIYRNSFYQYASSTATLNIANNVSAQEHLSLVDGGEAFQNNHIFPLLVPTRNLSVILVNDNPADAANFPDGSELLTTYVQSPNHSYASGTFGGDIHLGRLE
jgi:lysophospholipase